MCVCTRGAGGVRILTGRTVLTLDSVRTSDPRAELGWGLQWASTRGAFRVPPGRCCAPPAPTRGLRGRAPWDSTPLLLVTGFMVTVQIHWLSSSELKSRLQGLAAPGGLRAVPLSQGLHLHGPCLFRLLTLHSHLCLHQLTLCCCLPGERAGRGELVRSAHLCFLLGHNFLQIQEISHHFSFPGSLPPIPSLIALASGGRTDKG